MIRGIKTGGYLWAVIIGEDRNFVLSALETCITISKSLWPKERITFVNVEEELAKQARVRALSYSFCKKTGVKANSPTLTDKTCFDRRNPKHMRRR